MALFFIILIVIILLYAAARIFAQADIGKLARFLKYFSGFGLLVIALGLGILGRWALAFPLIAIAFSMLSGRGILGGISGVLGRKTTPTPGQSSHVRSAWLEMKLDHDSGLMQGEVIAGQFVGCQLASLSIPDLLTLYDECRRDKDSLALLEAYLDSREPAWREYADVNLGGGQSRATSTGTMTEEEAYEILGLSAGASEMEIRATHRRLMTGLHPDKGGSTYLAAKINQAKDRLL